MIGPRPQVIGFTGQFPFPSNLLWSPMEVGFFLEHERSRVFVGRAEIVTL